MSPSVRRPLGCSNTWATEAECETDGQSALKIFSDNPDRFDFAVIEPILPDLTGLDLAIRLKAIRPDLPVLFYAGYVDEALSLG